MPSPLWRDLPTRARRTVEDQIGPVLGSDPIVGGLMPGLAARLHLAGGRTMFAKACPPGQPGAARLLAREAWAAGSLPPQVPAPALRAAADAEGWAVLVFDHVPGRDADLAPESPDLPRVLAAVARLGEVAAPAGAPPVAGHAQVLLGAARRVLAECPLPEPQRDVCETALARFDGSVLAGSALLHYDLHPGNLRRGEDGSLWLLDWAFACAGAPWVELALLGPRLIEAGHAPARAQALLAGLPAWNGAPFGAADGLVAAWTLFRWGRALRGPDAGRAGRLRAAEAGLAWLGADQAAGESAHPGR
ncbi:phosphotransferase [Bailinhaonella thermotolerans]|uniref:phosphotransferase n=1 Tax=Bailinhaonella thermotolerans TaxID=1070861 RepID=UPI00192A2B84|nr:phosphotransferase [Bailinhaonella thermotolerans]